MTTTLETRDASEHETHLPDEETRKKQTPFDHYLSPTLQVEAEKAEKVAPGATAYNRQIP